MRSVSVGAVRYSPACRRPIACDVLVVGGGSSGCVVAGRLAAESDARGRPRRGRARLRPAGSRGDGRPTCSTARALVTSHDWGYASGALAGREPIAFPRARVIGGCSSHNGCVVAVGCPADYDGWAALTGDDRWSAVCDQACARAGARPDGGAHVPRGRGRSVPSRLPRRGERDSGFRARTTSTTSTAVSASGSSRSTSTDGVTRQRRPLRTSIPSGADRT